MLVVLQGYTTSTTVVHEFMKAADAVVVGAGPAGIAAVSQLVARRLRVHWIDRAFRSGAMARYSAVPANTKLDVLLPGLALFLPPN